MAWGNGKFAATASVGNSGADPVFLHSTDGITWESTPAQFGGDIASNGSMFVTGTHYSTDGIAWNEIDRVSSVNWIRSIIWGGDRFATIADVMNWPEWGMRTGVALSYQLPD